MLFRSIYTERNGIYIIDLQKSVGMVDDAYKAVADIAADRTGFDRGIENFTADQTFHERPSCRRLFLFLPVIAGGLISDKEDVMGALGAGAAAVSTTNQKVWEL